jgi:5-formyltetrahydrofolate cyclo-ligase
MKTDNPKQILRVRAKEVLKAMSAKRKETSSHHAVLELQERLLQFRHVLSFTSFGNEINLWPLNSSLAKQKKLCLPHDSFKLFLVESLSHLHPGPKPNLEPNPSICQEIAFQQIDCILTPALLFDKRGFRLGFGGGFYDKLLKERSKNALILGVGYKEQLCEELLPDEAHDIPVDELLLF